MRLDWSLLNAIRGALSCPFLDAVVPRLTALGNGGAVWLLAAGGLLIAMPKDYSFPSGHTLSSVIAAAILTQTDRRFGLAAIPLAALIALSRLYLFVHFPSDVLAAAALGLAIGIPGYRGLARLLERASARGQKKI